MIELENLRANFASVLKMASLGEIETMLRVLGDELGPRFHDPSVLVYQAAQQLHEYRRGKRIPPRFARDPVSRKELGEDFDAGGESG